MVPTISFRLLYGLLIISHGRRQILWFGATARPAAEWIANQLTCVNRRRTLALSQLWCSSNYSAPISLA